jgi:hypothetical protein
MKCDNCLKSAHRREVGHDNVLEVCAVLQVCGGCQNFIQSLFLTATLRIDCFYIYCVIYALCHVTLQRAISRGGKIYIGEKNLYAII